MGTGTDVVNSSNVQRAGSKVPKRDQFMDEEAGMESAPGEP